MYVPENQIRAKYSNIKLHQVYKLHKSHSNSNYIICLRWLKRLNFGSMWGSFWIPTN